MSASVLRVATRRSALALAQTRMIARAIERANPGSVVEELQLVTEGDRVQDRALREAGGKGLFVKELEQALLDGRADFAVHSLKDVPAELADGLTLACVPERASPYDRLLTLDGRALDALPANAVLGTSSLRRSLQLAAVRPDLRVELLRGNVDTRLRRLREGAYDAIVLAEAGLTRLGLEAPGISLAEVLVPSVGQGALALECRGDDARTKAMLAPLEHPVSRAEITAERAVLVGLGANCSVPLGAHARFRDGRLELRGWYAEQRADGAWSQRAHALEGPAHDAASLGARLAGMFRGERDAH